jgi:hypothetical protein
MAGLDVVQIIREPVAAALAYGLNLQVLAGPGHSGPGSGLAVVLHPSSGHMDGALKPFFRPHGWSPQTLFQATWMEP